MIFFKKINFLCNIFIDLYLKTDQFQKKSKISINIFGFFEE